MSDQIPDSISFSTLRELHGDKANKLDFSSPAISDDIGDLAFIVTQFIAVKLDGSFTHQQIFLADVLVTNLRRLYEERLKKAEGGSKKEILMLSRFLCVLNLVEDQLDELVEDCMKSLGSNSTLPSYKLIKTMDPSVRPHEIEEWIKGLR